MNSSKFIVKSIEQVKNNFFESLLERSYPKYLEKKQGDYLAIYTNEIKIIIKDFEESNSCVARKDYDNKQIRNISRSLSALLSYFSHFVILVYAGILVYRGDFSAGDFFVAIGMIDQLSYPIISLSPLIQNLISVKPVSNDLLNFINTSESTSLMVEEHTGGCQKIEFNDVSFAYDGSEVVIDGFSCTFHHGGKYLIRGISGSGKTTSMNLLLGYFTPNSGNVKIDDVEVNQIANLNQLITIMRQDAILFEDSLRNNITMYQDIPDEKIIEVLREVGLEKYANYNSLDMPVNESGTNLSGGEKRRVTLARSIIRESPILILDEPLANLDEKNMKSITEYLMTLEDKILIIISHQFDSSWQDKLTGVVEF
ncbi:MAG: ABC transporter ATP-binding protein [Tissierellia bacterium]|nr:ABC transporter ATP-binding protein [Tissierellia bacterium]